jgi:hypothetical protein
MDTLFDGTAIAIQANFEQKSILETSIITLDNIGVKNVGTMVSYTDGDDLNLSVENINFVVIGNIEADGSAYGQYSVNVQSPSPNLLNDSSGANYYRDAYFGLTRPQYAGFAVGDIISVKDHGAVGNGATDDTAAIVSALAEATTGNLIYFPPGSYLITSTIVIPTEVHMTGQVWSQLVASGPYFSNMADPKPMIQVGKPGDVGTVEMSDLLFTSIGELPGLIMVEWNIQADHPGSVGMWDCRCPPNSHLVFSLIVDVIISCVLGGERATIYISRQASSSSYYLTDLLLISFFLPTRPLPSRWCYRNKTSSCSMSYEFANSVRLHRGIHDDAHNTRFKWLFRKCVGLGCRSRH